MPFLLAEILNFQGSTHHIGVGSFSHLFYCVVVGGSSDGTCYSYGSDLREP